MSPGRSRSSWLVAVLPGDGIGVEVTMQAETVLRAVAERYELEVELRHADVGGAAIDNHGEPLPEATLELCRQADAVLLGAVGGPKWSDPQAAVRPEQGLLKLRAELELFANLRPIRPLASLRHASPLRPEMLEGVDMLFVRELTGGLYFGPRQGNEESAHDTCIYTRREVERVARVAGQMARGRRNRVTSVDKANVLATSRLWRAATTACFAAEFPEVALEHRLVDATAIHVISRPASFDVILTENLFGDILSDEASVLCGSIGMLPSASLGDGPRGLYEPVHGSAPDIAGRGIANPYAAILCVALMLRHSLESSPAADAVEKAVERSVDAGFLTADISYGESPPVSTDEATGAVLARLAG